MRMQNIYLSIGQHARLFYENHRATKKRCVRMNNNPIHGPLNSDRFVEVFKGLLKRASKSAWTMFHIFMQDTSERS
jgi:hypothetical protein